jgi:hypothetical protein
MISLESVYSVYTVDNQQLKCLHNFLHFCKVFTSLAVNDLSVYINVIASVGRKSELETARRIWHIINLSL